MIRSTELREAYDAIYEAVSLFKPKNEAEKLIRDLVSVNMLLLRVCDRLAARIETLELELDKIKPLLKY